ncbi:MAG: ribonuclease [Clostridiales bacterium]|nr:ribonuclease [Clostridiales bacterium]
MRSFIRRFSFVLLAISILFTAGCTEQSAAVLANAIIQSIGNSVSSTAESAGYSNDFQLVSPDPSDNASENTSDSAASNTGTNPESVVYGQPYSSKDDVAAYLHEFGELPPNYITKAEAQSLGWDNTLGNLWEVTDHKSIGGDYFGNYENLLPRKKGRTYHECDINFKGRSRGPERIVYSNDGLIYYSSDHYNTFTLLYGEE